MTDDRARRDLSARLASLSPERRAAIERLRREQRPEAQIEPQERPEAAVEPDRIAIVGSGCRFPGGAHDADSFWQLLQDRVETAVPVPAERWDAERRYDPDPDAPGGLYVRHGSFLAEPIDQFDAAFFGISAGEARSMDPQQRLLLEVSWEALEDAAIAPDRLAGSQTGVFVGIGLDDYKSLEIRSEADITAYSGTGNLLCVAAGRISYVLGLHGPAIAVDTGCSSSLVAVHLACQSLRCGESDLALAGGVHLMLTPDMTMFLCRAHALAPDGHCKTFDEAADGYLRGEGCGVIVLKRLRDAQADGDRVLAVIAGSAINHDGASSGLTAPSGPAQQALIRRALRNARLRPADLTYVETHGAGTALGDPIEVQAIGAVLAEDPKVVGPLLVGAVKTNIGHLEAAAGIAGLQKVVLALRHEEIPANLNLSQPNSRIPWGTMPIVAPTRPTPWRRGSRRRVAGVSSFGISGTNAHVIVQEAPIEETPAAQTPAAQTPAEEAVLDVKLSGRRPELLVLSARSGSALRTLAAAWARRLRTSPADALADLAYTSRVGRARFAERLAVVGDSAEAVAERLAAFAEDVVPERLGAENRAPERSGAENRAPERSGDLRQGRVGSRGRRVALAFTGHELDRADVQAESPIQAASAIQAESGIGHELYAREPAFRAAHDRAAQALGAPARGVLSGPCGLFALQYALAELWRAWGVTPAVVLGQGANELVAACVAGAVRLEDAARLVRERAPVTSQAAHQDVTAQAAHEGVTAQAVRERVAAGNGAMVDQLPLVGPVSEELDAVLREVVLAMPRLKLISTVTGTVVGSGDVPDRAHWRELARRPIEPTAAVSALLDEGCDVVIEIGPAPTLAATIARAAQRGRRHAAPALITSLREDVGELRALHEALADLFVLGIDFDPDAGRSGRRLRRCAAPTYPFERERYWTTSKATRELTAPAATPDAEVGGYPGRQLRSPALRDVVFDTVFTATAPGFLPDHRVFGEVVVPGASHVAMLLAAAARSGRDGPAVIDDVRFTRALTVWPDDRRPVQLVLREDGAWSVVSMATPDAERWETHATGDFRQLVAPPALGEAAAAGAEPFVGDVPAAAAQPADQPGSWLHERMDAAGYQLGPGFRWITELRRHPRGLDAELVAPSGCDEDLPLHPALLDSCFQALLAAVPEALDVQQAAAAGIYVPAEIARVRYSGLSAGARTRCVVRLGPEPWTPADPIRGDVHLLDAEGRRLVDLEGVVMRRLPAAALLGRDQPPSSTSLINVLDWPEVDIAPQPADVRGQRWLLCTSGGELAAVLERRLMEGGAAVTRVPSGSPEGRAGGEPVDVVVVLWGADRKVGAFREGADDTERDDGEAAGTDPTGLSSSEQLLRVLPTLVAGSTAQPPRLLVVTRATQQVRPGEAVEPAHAQLWGLTRVIGVEHPELRPLLIDLQRDGDCEAAATALLRAAGAGLEQAELGFRNGRAHLARRSPRTLPQGHPALDPRGMYIITGGSGALGTLFARHLSELGARSLLLLGRSAPAPEAQAAAAELRAIGVEVQHERVDVADRGALARVLERARQTTGRPIRGVLHAAGVLDDGVLVQQTVERLRRVAAPKASGAWNLHTLLADDQLDLFVLFSSAAAFTGTAGQGTYAAANAFLDALALQRHARGLPANSIAWGVWAGIGLAAQLHQRDLSRQAERGLAEIDVEEGVEAFDQLVAGALPFAGVFHAATAPRSAEPELAPRPASLGDYSPPTTTTEQALAQLWEAHFGFTPIGVSDHFVELGGDSILSLRLVTSAWKAGLPLEDTDLFAHPTIAELAPLLEDRAQQTAG